MKQDTKAVASLAKELAAPGEKPPADPKWIAAQQQAYHTGRMANTLAKALAKRYAHRWQFVDFLGPNGRESAGIVDILAVRKSGRAPNTPGLKRYDTFETQIIQVKGGKAPRPKAEEIARLRVVQRLHGAVRVVLFEWRANKGTRFSVLDAEADVWNEVPSADRIFGRKS